MLYRATDSAVAVNCGWNASNWNLIMKKLFVGLLVFIIHAAIGTIGVGFVAFVSVSLVVSVLRHFIPTISAKLPSVLCTQVPGFPMQLAFGFLIGFLLWRRMKQRAAFWAWTPAVAFLLLKIAQFASARTGALEHFFGTESALRPHSFDQVVYMLPIVAAAAYSLGAFISSLGRSKSFHASHGVGG